MHILVAIFENFPKHYKKFFLLSIFRVMKLESFRTTGISITQGVPHTDCTVGFTSLLSVCAYTQVILSIDPFDWSIQLILSFLSICSRMFCLRLCAHVHAEVYTQHKRARAHTHAHRGINPTVQPSLYIVHLE